MTRTTHDNARSCHKGNAPRSLRRTLTLASVAALAATLAIGCSGNPITGPEPLPNDPVVVPQPAPQLQPVPQPTPVLQPTGKPDLVISNINFSPGAPTTSDEITFWVFVKNEGNLAASNSTLWFRVGGETNPAAAAIPALAPGEQYRYERHVTLSVAQSYQVTATADALNVVAESHENNNVRTRTFSVAQGSRPDLVVSHIAISPAQPHVGDHVTVTVYVKNVGSANAPASNVRLRVGGEGNPPTHSVPALAPGQEYHYSRMVTLHHVQIYRATGTADAMGQVSESHEGNNVTYRDFMVKP
jgi:subtilase family serine protease